VPPSKKNKCDRPLNIHFGERKIQPAEMMPGAIFREMFDGLLQKSTRIRALMREQTRHAAIKENGNRFGLRLPRSQRLLGWPRCHARAARSFFPSRTPIRGRLARDYDRAESFAMIAPADWRAAWENERAALAWQRGKPRRRWLLGRRKPNRFPFSLIAAWRVCSRISARMRVLFLQKAVEHLPEDSAWHHLGRLYLALAEMNV